MGADEELEGGAVHPAVGLRPLVLRQLDEVRDRLLHLLPRRRALEPTGLSAAAAVQAIASEEHREDVGGGEFLGVLLLAEPAGGVGEVPGVDGVLPVDDRVGDYDPLADLPLSDLRRPPPLLVHAHAQVVEERQDPRRLCDREVIHRQRHVVVQPPPSHRRRVAVTRADAPLPLARPSPALLDLPQHLLLLRIKLASSQCGRILMHELLDEGALAGEEGGLSLCGVVRLSDVAKTLPRLHPPDSLLDQNGGCLLLLRLFVRTALAILLQVLLLLTRAPQLLCFQRSLRALPRLVEDGGRRKFDERCSLMLVF
mmetsp:Transcript_11506/g.26289  ORF Transcript_11506/g.26289 Transcript_11506/m.26289 type:complete len:312 (-) Transcript_11506:854-1789(-)